MQTIVRVIAVVLLAQSLAGCAVLAGAGIGVIVEAEHNAWCDRNPFDRHCGPWWGNRYHHRHFR